MPSEYGKQRLQCGHGGAAKPSPGESPIPAAADGTFAGWRRSRAGRILVVVATPGVFLVLQPPLESAFLVFPESKQPPKLVEYFGKVLPYAMTGLLVVYALRNTPILTGSHGIPGLIACAVITLLHLWKRNMLLSTAGGTAVYMLLIQLVF